MGTEARVTSRHHQRRYERDLSGRYTHFPVLVSPPSSLPTSPHSLPSSATRAPLLLASTWVWLMGGQRVRAEKGRALLGSGASVHNHSPSQAAAPALLGAQLRQLLPCPFLPGVGQQFAAAHPVPLQAPLTLRYKQPLPHILLRILPPLPAAGWRGLTDTVTTDCPLSPVPPAQKTPSLYNNLPHSSYRVSSLTVQTHPPAPSPPIPSKSQS